MRTLTLRIFVTCCINTLCTLHLSHPVMSCLAVIWYSGVPAVGLLPVLCKSVQLCVILFGPQFMLLNNFHVSFERHTIFS